MFLDDDTFAIILLLIIIARRSIGFRIIAGLGSSCWGGGHLYLTQDCPQIDDSEILAPRTVRGVQLLSGITH